MYCFNHHENSAVGICKYCQKALCSECAVDTGVGLACQGKCETELKNLEVISKYNQTMAERMKGNYKRSALFVGLMALIFLMAAMFLQNTAFFLAPMGFLFLGVAFFNYREGKKHQEKQSLES